MTIDRKSYELPNGLTLSVLEKGTGRPIVFVHGSVTTSELFREMVEYFGDTYRTIAVDLRGYGESQKPEDGFEIRQFSDDLADLFKVMNVQSPVLLGVSMGGFVAQDFALRYPGVLKALVLASTSDGELAPGLFDKDPVAEIVSAGWETVARNMVYGAFPEGTNENNKKILFERIQDLGADVLRGVCRTILDFDVSADIHSVNIPTLIMVGTEDHQLPVYLSERLQRKIAGSQLEIFDGAGHFMMVEQPKQFRTVLTEFLDSLGN